MSDPRDHAREEQAKRFDAIATEAAALADHARIAATHFRNAEVARAGAHALALQGHLVNLGRILDEIAVVHASRAQRTL
jgi:hypothetical protein